MSTETGQDLLPDPTYSRRLDQCSSGTPGGRARPERRVQTSRPHNRVRRAPALPHLRAAVAQAPGAQVALVQAGQRVRRGRVPRGRAHGARVALEVRRALRGPVAGRQPPQRRAVCAAWARGRRRTVCDVFGCSVCLFCGSAGAAGMSES